MRKRACGAIDEAIQTIVGILGKWGVPARYGNDTEIHGLCHSRSARFPPHSIIIRNVSTVPILVVTIGFQSNLTPLPAIPRDK